MAERSVSCEAPIFTIGHSTRSIAEFVDLLRHGPADFIVDLDGAPAILPWLHGTLTVLKDTHLSDEAVLEWLLKDEEELGMSPLAALRSGKRAPVRRIAQTLL